MRERGNRGIREFFGRKVISGSTLLYDLWIMQMESLEKRVFARQVALSKEFERKGEMVYVRHYLRTALGKYPNVLVMRKFE